MSRLNRAKISLKIYNQLLKKGLLKEIKIYRIEANDFGEKLNDSYVCTVKGYYYLQDRRINIFSNESATVNTNYNEKLLITFNDISQKIKRDDYFVLNNIKYMIIEPGNVENIILDMSIKRI